MIALALADFAGRGWTILNFAIIGNETRYHSTGDDLASLDRRLAVRS